MNPLKRIRIIKGVERGEERERERERVANFLGLRGLAFLFC